MRETIFARLEPGDFARNSQSLNPLKDTTMSRKKTKEPEELLSHNLIIRVNEATFKRLEKLHQESHSASMAEVARRILAGQKIKLFYKDISMNAPMEEMALIRKELKAIGININQLTRSFNQDKTGTHQAFYLLKVAGQYDKVGEKVDYLLTLISKLAEQWLRRS
jgi:hypothetical protein